MENNKIEELKQFGDDFEENKEIIKPVILIVDDDSNVREALHLALQKKYDTIVCANGDEGIKNVSFKVFTVVLDIKMEGKSGFETFKEIKSRFPYVPIIFYSGFQDLKSPFEIINDYRPFGYILKGGEAKTLLDTIDSAVDYYKQINKNEFLVKKLEKTNKELEKSEKKYKELVENSLDLIFSLDSEGRIIAINRSVTKILKYNKKDIVNKHFIDLVYKLNIINHININERIFQEKFQELAQSKETVFFTCELVTEIGEPREMNIRLQYLPIDNDFHVLGTASYIEEDILLKMCESENQVYKIENYLTQVDMICQRLSNAAIKYAGTETALDLKLCLRELLVNSMEHGNLGINFDEKSEALMEDTYFQLLIYRQLKPENIKKRITIEYSLIPEKIEISITDEGEGFNHKNILTRSKYDPSTMVLGHGRGIMMAKGFFDKIEYNKKGNSVYLLKSFSDVENKLDV
ncbi:MAG: ATP-binding protein [Leptospiraceae bacterium]|nr:ATP-binding protein [Leptospiraceae bacterium]MCP5494391.1 ATP-binding protein [Leptospiraceae bacterium]